MFRIPPSSASASRPRRALAAVAALAATAAITVSPLTATTASATPPSATYSVTVDSTGSFPYQTDSPASPYIDKDGTFYFQQSYNQYDAATTPDHYWQFFSGTTMDTATENTAISNAVDPNNPQDSNANTVWRCQNSPTGLTATPSSGYPLDDYCDLIGTWVDPDTGDWYGLVHNEFTGQPFGDGLHYDSIDWAVSRDQGKTWKITGHAITSPYSTTRGDTTAFPNQSYDYGDGDPRLYVDAASGYFYLYYTSRIVPKGGAGGNTDSLAHVARAPISGKLATGTWQKWYDGAWSQPGVGGLESNMVPVTSANANGYTPVANDYNPATTGTTDQQIAAGTLPPKSDLLTMNIAYDAYLGLYIGEPEVNDQDTGAPQRFYVTDDLATQKWYLIGDTGSSYATGSWYRWFLDNVNKTSSTIIGKTFRSYCSTNCMNLGSEATITIGSTAPAASPIDTSKTYLIGSGSGRVLAQVSGGSATTSVPAATGSALQSWSFKALGDGSFTITNAGTGQALGVDSSTTAGRAWGTKPTAAALGAGGATVGQEWFVIKNAAGTFRLVNRYSGLMLAMSSDTSRLAETTPLRNWTNATGNAVGGTRTEAEQTLNFTPTGSGVDIAQGKATTASSTENANFPAAFATDGDPGTRWSSAYSDPQWLQVDLGQSYAITHATLNWEAAYAKAYQIQTSPDGTNWTTVYSTTTGAGGTDDLAITGTGRYIRMYGTARGTGYGYSLWGFSVQGTPTSSGPTLLSQGRPTTASSIQSTMYPAAAATDGDPTTRWSSAPSDPQWLQVDLGATHTLTAVDLNWETAFATAFKIQTSNDGTTWTTVYSTTSGTGGVQNLAVSGSGRYVRMLGTTRATGYGYSLWEFQVYGT